MRLRRIAAALLAAAAVIVGLGSSPALADPDNGDPVKAGQFCKKEHLGQTWFTDLETKEHDVICKKITDGVYQWKYLPGFPKPDPRSVR